LSAWNGHGKQAGACSPGTARGALPRFRSAICVALRGVSR